MLLNPKTLPVPCELSHAGIEQACELLGTIEPWTYLLCTDGSVGQARKAIEDWTGIKIAVVSFEVLDPDQWLLVGPNGVVWSGRV